MQRAKFIGLASLTIVGLVTLVAAQAEKGRVFYNGEVFTGEPEHPYAQAVAIRDDKIVAVGAQMDVMKAAGTDAEKIDLQGKTLLPGLIDSHAHVMDSSTVLTGADVDDKVRTLNDLVAFVAEARHSGRGMRGRFLDITSLSLDFWSKPEELNARFSAGEYSDLPLLLEGADGHAGWANKALLREAGVTKEFLQHLSSQERRFYGFGPNLEPNGFAVDDGLAKVSAVVPDYTPAQLLEAGRAAVAYNHSLGITAWLEPASTYRSTDFVRRNILAVYRTLSERGELGAHVAVFPRIDPKVKGDPLPEIQGLRTEFKDVPNLAIPGIKFFEDGVVEYPSHTAALSKPYSDGSNGELLFDRERLSALATAADRQGLIVHVHAIGDLAVKTALDAIAAARRANGNSGLPHTITHIQFADPKDFPRFGELGVIASLQLLWAQGNSDAIEAVKPYIDPEIYRWQYPARSLLDAGATIAGASDWAVSSANVFEALYYAETRKGDEGVLDASQRVPREAMLFAYTRNSARALNMLDQIGTIAPGKQADLVLVDRDVMTVPAEELKQTKVLWTMFGGKIVYRAEKGTSGKAGEQNGSNLWR
jgi:predicted amidohydrolase YtcJ